MLLYDGTKLQTSGKFQMMVPTYNDIATADPRTSRIMTHLILLQAEVQQSNSITVGGMTVSGSITSSANNAHVIGGNTNRFATVYATTFDGTAVQAQYADLAENYTSDAEN